jgi:hypothetical protein
VPNHPLAVKPDPVPVEGTLEDGMLRTMAHRADAEKAEARRVENQRKKMVGPSMK